MSDSSRGSRLDKRSVEVDSSAISTKGDLCDSCRSADVCIFCTDDREPVLSCPAYQSIDDKASGARTATVSERTSFSPTPTNPGDLCSRCRVADTCTKLRPPGGVWQCEEYR